MATYTKRPRLGQNAQGIYEIRWTEAGRRTRTRSTGTRDHAEAQQALADFLSGRQAAQEARQDPTVAWAMGQYLEEHIRPHAADVRRSEITARWVTEWAGDRRVSSLTPRDGLKYATARRTGEVGRPAGDGTIRFELGALQAALNYLVEERILDKEDVVVLKRPKAPQARDQWLTEDQVRVMLAWFEARDAGQRMSRAHRFVVLALATASRKTAIEQLTWAHVDRAHGLIRFDHQVQVQTRKRRVPVPIADWLEPYLERMAAERETDLVLDHDGAIRHTFEHVMDLLARETGDKTYRRLTRHALRHTAATLALRNGATIWQVAGLLGDTPTSIMNIYGHHSPDNIKGAARAWWGKDAVGA